MFPAELQQRSYRETNGEWGWTSEQIPSAVDILRSHNLAILGGELWWVRDGVPGWTGSVPQRHGPNAVYCWETRRESGEQWLRFAERCASETLSAVKRWPEVADLPPDLPGRILFNLTWVSEEEFAKLDREPRKKGTSSTKGPIG